VARKVLGRLEGQSGPAVRLRIAPSPQNGVTLKLLCWVEHWRVPKNGLTSSPQPNIQPASCLDNWGVAVDFLNLDRQSVVPLLPDPAAHPRSHPLGKIEPGKPLPSEEVISKRLNVSRMTARQALKSLCSLGVAYSQREKAPSSPRPSSTKTSARFSPSAKRWRRGEPSLIRECFVRDYFAGDEVREALHLGTERQVIRLRRVRMADSLPMAWRPRICHSDVPRFARPIRSARFLVPHAFPRSTRFISCRPKKSWKPAWPHRKKRGFCDIEGSPVFLFTRTATCRAARQSSTSVHIPG